MKSCVAIVIGGLWATGCVAGCRGGEISPVRNLKEWLSYGDNQGRLPNHVPVLDATGTFATASERGFIDLRNEFFQNLGTNGRRCVSCHVPTAGWTVTPRQLEAVFEATAGG